MIILKNNNEGGLIPVYHKMQDMLNITYMLGLGEVRYRYMDLTIAFDDEVRCNIQDEIYDKFKQ